MRTPAFSQLWKFNFFSGRNMHFNTGNFVSFSTNWGRQLWVPRQQTYSCSSSLFFFFKSTPFQPADLIFLPKFSSARISKASVRPFVCSTFLAKLLKHMPSYNIQYTVVTHQFLPCPKTTIYYSCHILLESPQKGDFMTCKTRFLNHPKTGVEP